MSRCFPFPPPGYEKKARPVNDANLLLKEKEKEKKHKKDKKDKEKKERKDKKDKERSSEKHREKKDRKHKHKDKNSKNRDNEDKKASDEKKVVGLSDQQNGEKLGLIGIQVDQTQDSRFLLELEKRVRNENGARQIQTVDKIGVTNLSVKSPGKVLESNVGVLVEGNQKPKDKILPNGQSFKVNAMGLPNGFVPSSLEKEPRNEGGLCQAEKVSEKRKERKEKNKHRKSDDRGEKHKDGDKEKKSKSKDKTRKKEKEEGKVKVVSTPGQGKLSESGKNNVDIQNDKGPVVFKDSNAKNGNLGKRKEPETNGFLHGDEIPLNKFQRPLSSSEVIQNGSRINATNTAIQFSLERNAAVQKHKLNTKVPSSNLVVENGSKLEVRQTANSFAPERQEAICNHHKASDSLSSNPTLGIGRKPEVMSTNHVVNKKSLSSQPVAENGRELESNQPSVLTSAEMQGTVCNFKLDVMEPRINGTVGFEKPKACSLIPPAAGQLKVKVETHKKPPHPDSKYLSKILFVPKVDWSDVDDQAWLFTSGDNQAKKPKIDLTTFEEPKQVWAESVHIESADVTALPYVIPY